MLFLVFSVWRRGAIELDTLISFRNGMTMRVPLVYKSEINQIFLRNYMLEWAIPPPILGSKQFNQIFKNWYILNKYFRNFEC